MSAEELLEHPFIKNAGRTVSLQRLIMKWSEYKARHRSNAPVKSHQDLIAADEAGTIHEEWDYGNGTFADTIAFKRMAAAAKEETVSGTIRPVKGSTGQVFERDVQRTPRKTSIGDAYSEDGLTAERKRLATVVVNDQVARYPERPVSSSTLLDEPELMLLPIVTAHGRTTKLRGII